MDSRQYAIWWQRKDSVETDNFYGSGGQAMAAQFGSRSLSICPSTREFEPTSTALMSTIGRRFLYAMKANRFAAAEKEGKRSLRH
ncbi:hypothetical protein GKODMF_07990 [Candidatus Electrothrix gigas]